MKNLFLMSFFGMFLSSVGHANGLTIFPTQVHLEMKAGEVKTLEISVVNDSSGAIKDMEIKLREMIFTNEDKNILDFNKIRENKIKNSRSLVPYVKITNPNIDIPSKSKLVIPVIITVPKDFNGSGYFTYVIRSKDKKFKNQVGIRTNFNGMVAVNVTDKKQEKVEVKSVELKNKLLSVKYKNTGDSFLVLEGDVIILDGQKQVARLYLDSTEGTKVQTAYPDKTYSFTAPLLANLAKGKNYTLVVNIKDNKRQFIKTEKKSLNIN